MAPRVTLGLEACLASPPAALHGARFGVLMNQASVDRDFAYAHDLLGARFPGQLAALFGPQHGLWSEQQDNMVETPGAQDGARGTPIHSLYGEVREPTPAMLGDLDCIVVDLQDVGTRVYTFIWTLYLTLQACARAGVRVLVLDRPNPLGGTLIEGPRLDPAFRSFVGLLPIPMRHGLTIAEMAGWMNRDVGAALDVVPMQGWTRDMTWSDTGRAWIPPSPNLPRVEGVAFYPGQVLLEGTLLSEGRGTTTPFEVVGAPFIDPVRLRRALDALELPGVAFRAYRFEPTFQKFAGESCGGVFLHVTDASRCRPYRTTLAVLATARALYPDAFEWRSPPYEYETHLAPIDILTGSAVTREAIDAGASAADAAHLAEIDTAAWWQDVSDSLLYARPPA